MKNLLLAIAILTSITISYVCSAQDSSTSTVIYASSGAEASFITTQNILYNNICFDMVKKHLLLENILREANPSEDALSTIRQLENLVKTDIIQAVSLASDRQKTVKEYLQDSTEMLEKGNSIITAMRQELALIKLDLNACQADKQSADREYFQGIDAYDDKASTSALSQSIANDTCASQKRIEYNAKTYILNKLVFFESVLKQKYDIIDQEQDLIINHFEVISDTLIQKLQIINNVLKSYQF